MLEIVTWTELQNAFFQVLHDRLSSPIFGLGGFQLTSHGVSNVNLVVYMPYTEFIHIPATNPER